MARIMWLSDFFCADLNENFFRAEQSIPPEEVKAFVERESGVRKDHCTGRPNSSLVANSDRSLQAATGFLVTKDEEKYLFFNKFRRLYRLYKEIKAK